MFIDDILLYLRSRGEPTQYLSIVLQIRRDHVLFAKLSRCEFWIELMIFLRHMVSKDSIMVDPKKI